MDPGTRAEVSAHAETAGWPCKTCTYANPSGVDLCDVCTRRRPRECTVSAGRSASPSVRLSESIDLGSRHDGLMRHLPRDQVSECNPHASDKSREVSARTGRNREAKNQGGESRVPKRVRTSAVGGRVCSHGRWRHRCKECGGNGICEHGSRSSYCKECGGNALCVHGRLRQRCKECSGGDLCPHGRRRSQCKPCEGGSIMMCAHGRRRSYCQNVEAAASAGTGAR